ncbi:MAG: YkgJ family cysteine cluster protein, partial [Lachnospiraceae bacterium]|nr:YkgJ family cysteine cluster protein [Lachnospiraceae bacterium]
YECPYPSKTKVRIRKWLGINDLPAYEAFVLKWHDILEETRQEAAAITSDQELTAYLTGFLKKFYVEPYDTSVSFYDQFNGRCN